MVWRFIEVHNMAWALGQDARGRRESRLQKSRDLPQTPRRLDSPLPNRVFRLGVDV